MLVKGYVSPVRRRRRNRLNRFGRVVDHRWINASNVDVDRFKYGYDRNGNRTYKENGVIATLSEVYTNDNLNQLASYKLGTLNGGKTDVTGTPTNAQNWDYDAVGNWDSVTTNSTTQTRGANRQNEITSVSSATAPTYDSNGNLTKDENDNRFVYDAWNREVKIKNSSNTVIATNAYDALNHKVQVTTSSGTIDRFFSSDWQVLEEKSGSNTKNRYVWSPAYTDALVLRDRDTDSNGTLEERLYPLQDANWNTTGLVNTSGSVVERDNYSPFGVVTFRDASGASIGASAKDWLFLHQGGQTDIVGNYDFRNRVYSPTLGRWLTNDPLGFAAGDVNFYRYVGNGPGNGLDPLGLMDDVFKTIENLKKQFPNSERILPPINDNQNLPFPWKNKNKEFPEKPLIEFPVFDWGNIVIDPRPDGLTWGINKKNIFNGNISIYNGPQGLSYRGNIPTNRGGNIYGSTGPDGSVFGLVWPLPWDATINIGSESGSLFYEIETKTPGGSITFGDGPRGRFYSGNVSLWGGSGANLSGGSNGTNLELASPLFGGGAVIIGNGPKGTGIGVIIPVIPGIDINITKPIGRKYSFFLGGILKW